MFFLAFAGSIRIFTLFLNLWNSEVFLIPAVILLAIIFAFFQWRNKKRPPFDKGSAEQSEAVGLNECLPLSRGNVACDKGVKIPLGYAVSPFKNDDVKLLFYPFCKNLVIMLNILIGFQLFFYIWDCINCCSVIFSSKIHSNFL